MRLCVQYPLKRDQMFGEVGPGGRIGINWMLGHPSRLLKDNNGSDAALFFSSLANVLRAQALHHDILKMDPSDSPLVAAAKSAIRLELQTVEGFQFLACEWSKIVAYMLHRRIIYARGYWRQAEAADPE